MEEVPAHPGEDVSVVGAADHCERQPEVGWGARLFHGNFAAGQLFGGGMDCSVGSIPDDPSDLQNMEQKVRLWAAQDRACLNLFYFRFVGEFEVMKAVRPECPAGTMLDPGKLRSMSP